MNTIGEKTMINELIKVLERYCSLQRDNKQLLFDDYLDYTCEKISEELNKLLVPLGRSCELYDLQLPSEEDMLRCNKEEDEFFEALVDEELSNLTKEEEKSEEDFMADRNCGIDCTNSCPICPSKGSNNKDKDH